MPRVTPGYKLYLYQLLMRRIGPGRQTLLPQVEEVLAADGIIPQDLECETIQELVEACPDFLKLTVFKKGRAYATVIANEEWDAMLAAPPEKAPAAKAPAGGPKTWKKKKGGKKTLKAVKPGKQRRDREAAEAQAAAERAAAEAREAAERASAEALAAEGAAAEPEAPLAVADAEPSPAAASQTGPAPAETSAPAVTGALTLAEVMAQARAEEAAADGADEPSQPAGTAAPAPAAPAPAPEAEPAPEPEPAQTSAPAAPGPAPISLTITYDPYEDMERELARQREEARTAQPEPVAPPREAVEPQPAPEPAAQQPAGGPQISLVGLPEDVSTEVACNDALMRVLYQLLPFDVEPLAVLDEDWRVARSTGTLSGSRNRVSFPLHYLHEDGTPITATLRRTTRNASGKRWSLALVDGNDGTGSSHEAVGFEGLPAADEGAWADLSGTATNLAVSPVRELAQEVVIGTWDSFLGALATMAAPERWNYPGEGVGRASRYGILREYLCSSFRRVRCQQRIAEAADGSFAAFNTGLFTPFGEDIYCCLEARRGDIPWRFAGFATAGSGELGSRLAGTISPLPEQPSYLSALESVIPDQGRMVILDLESILGHQLGRLPRAFLDELTEGREAAHGLLAGGGALSADALAQLGRAIRQDSALYRRLRRTLDDAVAQSLRAIRGSYRLAVPVYDPAENRTKLLVPLCLVEDGRADCALVLDLQPSGAYRAAALLSLPRAYACARVISREQPAWLAPERALGTR